MKRTKLSLLLVVVALPVFGQQTVIRDYDEAREKYFWKLVYPDGGVSIYCQTPFGAGQKLTIEHVYSADWIAEARGCAKPMARFENEAKWLMAALLRHHTSKNGFEILLGAKIRGKTTDLLWIALP